MSTPSSSLRLVGTEAAFLVMSTRIPFRYGIAEMRHVPHVVLAVDVERGGRTTRGFAAEHLPPKWFTKDPDSTLEYDIEEMVETIQQVRMQALAFSGASSFDVWEQLAESVGDWAAASSTPPLVAGLGLSLVERAMIDAVCRERAEPFWRLLGDGSLGLRFDAIHPELAGAAVRDLLPETPLAEISIRHTVGLSDSLEDADVAPADNPADGLPVSTAGAQARYGIDHYKVKLSGDVDRDRHRLEKVMSIAERSNDRAVLTADGNEFFRDVGEFAHYWRQLTADADFASRLDERLLVIEQPLHRRHALSRDAMSSESAALPPMIIDESDEWTPSVREALDLGYRGGSFKGCKGVFRAAANQALIVARNRADGGNRLLTAEDLSTVPPLTLLQDLAVAAALGITHIERNGHQYFGDAAAIGPNLRERLVERHADLFNLDGGAARLRIDAGRCRLATVNAAPFGCAVEPSLNELPKLSTATILQALAQSAKQ